MTVVSEESYSIGPAALQALTSPSLLTSLPNVCLDIFAPREDYGNSPT